MPSSRVDLLPNFFESLIGLGFEGHLLYWGHVLSLFLQFLISLLEAVFLVLQVLKLIVDLVFELRLGGFDFLFRLRMRDAFWGLRHCSGTGDSRVWRELDCFLGWYVLSEGD